MDPRPKEYLEKDIPTGYALSNRSIYAFRRGRVTAFVEGTGGRAARDVRGGQLNGGHAWVVRGTTVNAFFTEGTQVRMQTTSRGEPRPSQTRAGGCIPPVATLTDAPTAGKERNHFHRRGRSGTLRTGDCAIQPPACRR